MSTEPTPAANKEPEEHTRPAPERLRSPLKAPPGNPQGRPNQHTEPESRPSPRPTPTHCKTAFLIAERTHSTRPSLPPSSKGTAAPTAAPGGRALNTVVPHCLPQLRSLPTTPPPPPRPPPAATIDHRIQQSHFRCFSKRTEIGISKDVHTPTPTAALFATAGTAKQPSVCRGLNGKCGCQSARVTHTDHVIWPYLPAQREKKSATAQLSDLGSV